MIVKPTDRITEFSRFGGVTTVAGSVNTVSQIIKQRKETKPTTMARIGGIVPTDRVKKPVIKVSYDKTPVQTTTKKPGVLDRIQDAIEEAPDIAKIAVAGVGGLATGIAIGRAQRKKVEEVADSTYFVPETEGVSLKKFAWVPLLLLAIPLVRNIK